MPDKYGNPTFADLFDNPEVFKQLYNVYTSANQNSPFQPEPAFQPQPISRIAGPAPESQWDQFRRAFLAQSENNVNAMRIYAPNAGIGYTPTQIANAGAPERREEQQQRAEMFNAGQENQFGRLAQQQQYEATRMAMRQSELDERQKARLDAQLEEARLGREAADKRQQTAIDAANTRQETDIKSRKDLEAMREAARLKEIGAKNAQKAAESNDKVAAQYQDTAARIDQARKQIDIMKAHYESALGISAKSGGQQTKSRGLSGWLGAELQDHPSIAYGAGYLGQGGKDAQLHETYRNSVATSLAPLLSGSKRAVEGIRKAILPTLPAFRDEPTVAAEKYKNIQMLLDISGSLPGANPQQRAAARAALREKITSFATDPNVSANMMRAFAAADADLDKDEIAAPVAGQRVPSPKPPPTGSQKSSKDVMDEIFR